jgi:hypothetical protein
MFMTTDRLGTDTGRAFQGLHPGKRGLGLIGTDVTFVGLGRQSHPCVPTEDQGKGRSQLKNPGLGRRDGTVENEVSISRDHVKHAWQVRAGCETDTSRMPMVEGCRPRANTKGHSGSGPRWCLSDTNETH